MLRVDVDVSKIALYSTVASEDRTKNAITRATIIIHHHIINIIIIRSWYAQRGEIVLALLLSWSGVRAAHSAILHVRRSMSGSGEHVVRHFTYFESVKDLWGLGYDPENGKGWAQRNQ